MILFSKFTSVAKSVVSNFWASINMSPEEKFLNGATDHADLKRRMEVIEESRGMRHRFMAAYSARHF